MKRRGALIAAIMLALTFSVGALSGMALEEALGIDWFEFLDEDRDRSSEDLLEGLGLSDEQEDQAERILDRREDALEQYWEQRLPEINRIVSQSFADIRVLLTPEQQTAFDKRVRRLDGVPGQVREP
jgi:Spy/CpxP family protein refolding chaperone